MKEFDPESLSQFNGKEGQPVYVAHKGRVFDVSASNLWKTGLHMKRHPAATSLPILELHPTARGSWSDIPRWGP